MNRRQLVAHCALNTVVGRLLAGGALLAALPAQSAKPVRIGLLINLSGVGAMYGPIARNCSDIAVSEINARGGIAGRSIELVVGDAGAEPQEVVKTALRMLNEEKVEAFVAMHNSAVRVALVKAFAGKIPYVYTTIYEGGECSKGTYLLGTTPSQQLRPVIPWMGWKLGVKRWYLVGNDYNWPRGTNAKAKGYIATDGGKIVGEEYVPFDFDNFDAVVKRIQDSKADAALITLVGTSSIRFNQVFGQAGISQSVVRLSTYLDEPTLAAIGSNSSSNLWSSAGYFVSIRTPAAKEFAAEYAKRFGAATLLNDSGQACYEGLRLLEVMGNRAKSLDVDKLESIAQWQITDGPRGQTVMHARHTVRDIYLAKADGTTFKVIKTFEAVRPDADCMV
jgi:urea transport system substrate-binding protein